MSSDVCHHGYAGRCAECELEGKLALLRCELSEMRHTCQTRLELNNALQARLGGALEERDKLEARGAEYDLEVATLRARVAYLEKQHDDTSTAFASGRRYERAWGEARAPSLDVLIVELKQQLKMQEDLIVDLQNQLEAERDRVVEERYARLEKDD